MEPHLVPDDIQTYIDKFAFIEAKKYLALKGPLRLNIVHDDMFPLFNYNSTLVISKPKNGISRGSLGCYWYNDQVFPCLITKVFDEGSFQVAFINKKAPSRSFTESHFLGQITHPKINLWWKFKLWQLRRRA